LICNFKVRKKLENFLPLGEFCKENCCGSFEIIEYNFNAKNFGSIDAQRKNCRTHCEAYNYRKYLDRKFKSS